MSRKNSRDRSGSRTKKLLPRPSGKLHLTKYGYHALDNKLQRQKTLRKAIKRNGKISRSKTLEVLRHLNLLTNLQSRITNSNAKKNMRQDVKYLQTIYASL